MKPTGHWVAAPMNIHRINWIWGSTKAMEQAGIKEPAQDLGGVQRRLRQGGRGNLICSPISAQDWTDATTFEVVVYGQTSTCSKKAFVEGDTAAMRSP
jgi:glucose/mannose transport system substrate-binding protein